MITLQEVPTSQRRNVDHVHGWIAEHVHGTKGPGASFSADTIDLKRNLVTYAAGLLEDVDRRKFVKMLRNASIDALAIATEEDAKFHDPRHPGYQTAERFKQLADHIERKWGK